MKLKNSLLLFGGLILIAVFAIIFLENIEPNHPIAEIYVDEELVREIDLSFDRDEEITISSQYGENILSVKKDSISVKSASCPDKLCISQGEITNSTKPIICLPNKMVIKIRDNKNSDIDMISQ